jgi:hypothetical protein
MALSLHRRHRLEWEAQYPGDSRSGEWDERKKSWKRCNFVIHLSGKFSRRSTGCTTWDDAKKYAAALEQTGGGEQTCRLRFWSPRYRPQPAPRS